VGEFSFKALTFCPLLYENGQKAFSFRGLRSLTPLPLDPAGGSAPRPRYRLALRALAIVPPLANPGSADACCQYLIGLTGNGMLFITIAVLTLIALLLMPYMYSRRILAEINEMLLVRLRYDSRAVLPRLHQPCLPPVDNGSSVKASIFTGRGFPPKTSSGYGGSALMLPGSAACNSCSPGNKAFNGHGNSGSNGNMQVGAGCGPRNCGSRNGGASAGNQNSSLYPLF